MPDVLGFLKKAAPWITAAATSNVPALIGLAAQAVSGVTKGKVDASPDAIADAIAGATPEQLAQLKQADDDFKLKMAALGYQNESELEKIAADDRASARSREMSIHDYTPEIGFYLLILIFSAAIHWLLKWPIPPENRAIVYTAFGSLGTLVVMAATYFYGSTRGSETKTQNTSNTVTSLLDKVGKR